MKYIVTINDKSYEVEVEKGQANIVKTSQAATVPAQIAMQTAATPSAPAAPAASAAPVATAAPIAAGQASIEGETLKAPLPGTILAIKVQPGDVVKKGEVLLILEAMKMENEIVAPRNGVVNQVLVGKGASVATGDVLLALK